MKRRILATLLSLCLLVGMLPTVALAEESGTDGETPVVYTVDDTPENIVTVTITEADMASDSENTTAIANAVSRLEIDDLSSITALKVTTEGNAYLSPEDNMYIKQNFTALTYLDESNSRCSTRVLTESYLEKSGLEDIEYEEFGGLSGFTSLKTLLIPETAQVINSYTLEGRGGGIDSTGLTTLTIPDSVLAFESGACSGITSFTGNLIIPNSVVFIGNNAFGAGTSIIDCGTLTLGNSVEYIDANGFKSRKFTGNLVIPDSVEYIGNWAFAEGSFANGTWTLGVGLHQIGSAAMNGICSGNTGTFTILKKWKLESAAFKNNSFDKVVFEEGYVDISTAQVIANSTKITEIVLPSTLKSISGSSAFSGCSALSAINLPDGLETIGVRVFENDDALTSVVLPSTLTTIGDSAFEDSGIVGAYIPASVTTIGNRVFQDIPSESIIYMANDTLLSAMTTSNSDWNKKYNAKNTALAVTNGGTFAEDTMFTAGTLATPTKDGAIFDGWYANDDFTGEKVTSASNGETYYAKWIGMDDMELQYAGTQQITVSENISLSDYKSSDSSVATVDSSGNVTATGVGTATISATGTYNGQQAIFEATVTVIPRVLTYTNTDGSAGSGSITYNYSGGHHALSDSLTFQWKDSPNTAVELEEGTDINYTYTVPKTDETPDGGTALTYDYLPMPVGTYSNVKFNLLNENYTFGLSDGSTRDYLEIDVNVVAEGSQRAYLASAAPKADQNFVYTGEGVLPVEGTLNAYADNNTSSTTVDIGTFTVNIEGLNDTAFHSEVSGIDAGTDLSSISGLTLPTEPGTYIITASAANDGYYLYKSLVFTISKATVTVKADDKSVYVGDAMPELTYTVSGLASGDRLTAEPTLTCNAADTNTAGTYTITPSGGAVNTARYTLAYENGTLTVSARSGGGGGGSGSSNVSGSGGNVTITASGGSVTASQMESAVNKAEEGAVMTIKATGSTTVSLPVGGMADAADNDNDVLLDLRYGEVTLTARTIAGLTDGVSSSRKIKVSITSLTSSKDEAISDLLDKGAAVFDVSVAVNDVEVHSFDGALTLTFTVSNLSKITDPHILHILTDGTKEYYAPDSISGNTVTVKGVRNLSTFAVIPGSEVPEAQTNPFTDVYESDYYYDAVLWAVENGVTNGTSATTFGPNVTVTRAQMVTFLWRAYGSPEATGANPFTDVSTSDYYYDAVLWAVANGVTAGTGATTFSPDAPVTRAQAVTFQWRAAGSPVVAGSSFDDVAADAYYADAVIWAVANGITNGTSGTTFSPDAAVSRAQAVTFLWRELA